MLLARGSEKIIGLTNQSAIRVAVVGVGSFGRNHARVYHELEKQNQGVELVAVVDSDPAQAQAVAGQFGCKGFSSVADLAGRVDAASIAVPTVHHLSVAASLMAAGVDVLIEKPLASSLEEADELVRLAAANQRIAQTGHLERFNPAVRATVPLLTKSFQATGRNASELANEISATYKSDKIYTNPHVTVIPEERFVNVGGDVRGPSRVLYTPDMTLLTAINSCGGFTEYANRKAVRITRGQQIMIVNCVQRSAAPRRECRCQPDSRGRSPAQSWPRSPPRS